MRNLRAQGRGPPAARPPRRAFTASEVADADELAILRAYLKPWKWEVGKLFDGAGPDSPDHEFCRIAPTIRSFASTRRRVDSRTDAGLSLGRAGS